MRRPIAGILAYGLSLFFSLMSAVAAETVAVPVIAVSQAEAGTLTIALDIVGLDVAELRAELSVDRKGASGTVTLRQGGSFSIAPEQSVRVGKVSVSFNAGDRLTALATVWQDQTIIATARTSVGPDAEN